MDELRQLVRNCDFSALQEHVRDGSVALELIKSCDFKLIELVLHVCNIKIVHLMLDAARIHQTQVVEWCLQRDDSSDCISVEDTNKLTVLRYAVCNGHVAALKIMIDRHRDAIKRVRDVTLMLAVHRGVRSVVDFLLENLEIEQLSLRSALSIAVKRNFLRIAKTLLMQRGFIASSINVMEIFERNMIELLPLLVTTGSVYNDLRVFVGLPIALCCESPEMLRALIFHCGTPTIHDTGGSRRIIAPRSRDMEFAHDAVFCPRTNQSEDDVADVRFRMYFSTSLLDRLLFSMFCRSINPCFSALRRQ